MQDSNHVVNGEIVKAGECAHGQIYPHENLNLKEDNSDAGATTESTNGKITYSLREIMEKLYSSSRHDRRAFLKSFSRTDRPRLRKLFEKYRHSKIENGEAVMDEK